jgi:hypothetical protein
MRTSAIAFVLLAVCSGNSMAEEAKDSVVRLAATRKAAVYRVGEQIDLNAVFSETSPGHCLVSNGFDGVRNPWFRQSGDEFHVVRADGAESAPGAVYDPYFDEHEFNTSIQMIEYLSGLPSLGGGPRSIHFVLNEWVRIAVPGEYRVTLETNRISRCTWGVDPPVPVPPSRSNEVRITIIPGDDRWAASELQQIRRVLDGAPADSATAFAIRRLGYLNTRDSTIEMAARFMADETDSNRQLLAEGLFKSSWRDIAISALDRSFHAEKQAPESIHRVLAMLLVAREFQDRPLPDAPDERQRAIEARGIRFKSILEELYSARPDSRRPLY